MQKSANSSAGGPAEGFDRVLLVADVGRSFRGALDPQHDEGANHWPEAAWRAYLDALASASRSGCAVVEPAPFGAAAEASAVTLDLEGRTPSARDVIATIARWWRSDEQRGPKRRLRIIARS